LKKISKEKINEIWKGSPHVIIGKHGWEAAVDEIKRQIKKKKIIKVKLLKTARVLPKEEIAEKIANSTGSNLIEIRGNQMIFHKKI
jgi:RNA-binding protein